MRCRGSSVLTSDTTGPRGTDGGGLVDDRGENGRADDPRELVPVEERDAPGFRVLARIDARDQDGDELDEQEAVPEAAPQAGPMRAGALVAGAVATGAICGHGICGHGDLLIESHADWRTTPPAA